MANPFFGVKTSGGNPLGFGLGMTYGHSAVESPDADRRVRRPLFQQKLPPVSSPGHDQLDRSAFGTPSALVAHSPERAATAQPAARSFTPASPLYSDTTASTMQQLLRIIEARFAAEQVARESLTQELRNLHDQVCELQAAIELGKVREAALTQSVRAASESAQESLRQASALRAAVSTGLGRPEADAAVEAHVRQLASDLRTLAGRVEHVQQRGDQRAREMIVLVESEARARAAAIEGQSQRLQGLEWRLADHHAQQRLDIDRAAASAAISTSPTVSPLSVPAEHFTAVRAAVESESEARRKAQARYDEDLARLASRTREELQDVRSGMDSILAATTGAVAELASKVREQGATLTQLGAGAAASAASLAVVKGALGTAQDAIAKRLDATDAEIRRVADASGRKEQALGTALLRGLQQESSARDAAIAALAYDCHRSLTDFDRRSKAAAAAGRARVRSGGGRSRSEERTTFGLVESPRPDSDSSPVAVDVGGASRGRISRRGVRDLADALASLDDKELAPLRDRIVTVSGATAAEQRRPAAESLPRAAESLPRPLQRRTSTAATELTAAARQRQALQERADVTAAALEARLADLERYVVDWAARFQSDVETFHADLQADVQTHRRAVDKQVVSLTAEQAKIVALTAKIGKGGDGVPNDLLRRLTELLSSAPSPEELRRLSATVAEAQSTLASVKAVASQLPSLDSVTTRIADAKAEVSGRLQAALDALALDLALLRSQRLKEATAAGGLAAAAEALPGDEALRDLESLLRRHSEALHRQEKLLSAHEAALARDAYSSSPQDRDAAEAVSLARQAAEGVRRLEDTTAARDIAFQQTTQLLAKHESALTSHADVLHKLQQEGGRRSETTGDIALLRVLEGRVAAQARQIDDLKGTGSAVLQLQADIAELRLAPRGERNSSPSVEHLQGLFVTQDALKAVAGELQAQIYRLHAAESSSDSKPVSPVSQDATASSNLVLLHEAVASLQLLVTQGVTEWQAALEDERTARMAGDAACSALVSSESKERTTDLDELADDVREQLAAAYDKITSRVTAAVSQQLGVMTEAVNGLSDYTEVTRACQFIVDTVADAYVQDLCVRVASDTTEGILFRRSTPKHAITAASSINALPVKFPVLSSVLTSGITSRSDVSGPASTKR